MSNNATQAEVDRLRGIIERVAWRTARMVGVIEGLEPLPEDYDLEDLHAKLETIIGIERYKHSRIPEQIMAIQYPEHIDGYDGYGSFDDALKLAARVAQEVLDDKPKV